MNASSWQSMINPSTWFSTQEVAPRTWAISDHGQDMMYLLQGDTQALLLDTGFGVGDLRAVVAGLLGPASSLPLTVANTHGHVDHATGNWQFPRVYIGAEDVPMISQPLAAERCAGLVEGWRQRDEAALRAVWPPDGLPPAEWAAIVPAEIIPIREGYTFDLGGRTLETISVPGHTRGSICLLDRAARMLFTGDDVHNGHIWMHLDHCTTLREYLESLRHLQAGWDGTYDCIFWGHFWAPISPSLLPRLMAGVEDVLAGRAVGQPFDTFAGDGLCYDFGMGRLIYRPERLG